MASHAAVAGMPFPRGYGRRAAAALLGSVFLVALPFRGEAMGFLEQAVSAVIAEPEDFDRPLILNGKGVGVVLLQHGVKTMMMSVAPEDTRTSESQRRDEADNSEPALVDGNAGADAAETSSGGNGTVVSVNLRSALVQEAESERSSGLVYSALAKARNLWHKDVFAVPSMTASELLNTIIEHEIDWVVLGVSVIVLLLLDFFVVQPLADRYAGTDSTSSPVTEASLREAFDNCDPKGKGCAAKDDLVCACEGMLVESRVRDLSASEGATITWEEFRGVCGPESGAGARSGHNAMVGHCAVFAFWVLMGFAFNAYVWIKRGQEDGIHWMTGYLLEWLLSLDNIFIFHLVFRTYNTPKPLLHKALFAGIIGAVVFRMAFFMALTSLLHLMKWVRFVFGAMLIYSGIQAAQGDGDDEDVSNLWTVQLIKRCMGDRLMESYDLREHRLFVRGADGRLRATLLVLVIACLELTDIFFAIDSVSAKVAQIPDYYLSYSSSILAIFGLRGMFFVVQDMVDEFDLLKYGLCFILVFIGIELMISDWVQLPAQVVCVVIASVFVVGIAGSVMQHYAKDDKKETNEPEAPPAIAGAG